NDCWRVLRNGSEGRNEVAVPVLSNVPYFGRLFRSVGIGRDVHNLWIPRENAIIQGRVRGKAKATNKHLPEAPQSKGETSQVVFLDKEKMRERTWVLCKVAGDQFTFAQTLYEEEASTGVPWGIPFVGAVFRKDTVE